MNLKDEFYEIKIHNETHARNLTIRNMKYLHSPIFRFIAEIGLQKNQGNSTQGKVWPDVARYCRLLEHFWSITLTWSLSSLFIFRFLTLEIYQRNTKTFCAKNIILIIFAMSTKTSELPVSANAIPKDALPDISIFIPLIEINKIGFG